eukprot:CAMPEP_0172480126 /NCGR_PEP_ID=MMETSP1066-20121228/5083_1 /TAXON_ID=671091 /ORGANISM="Coscinodiscus wailesii, Strain CCMP2513" /LENGTH=41 /DNA_ID= /DNA_START= /DNA_END= /DNA_ORIENTATION=
MTWAEKDSSGGEDNDRIHPKGVMVWAEHSGASLSVNDLDAE